MATDRQGKKDLYTREQEESDRLVRPNPKQKPPRRDLRRDTVEPEKDPDLDPKDPDLSMNYKTIGGSSYVGSCSMDRHALYRGIDPFDPTPYDQSGTGFKTISDLTESDFEQIVAGAKKLLKSEFLGDSWEKGNEDTRYRAALDHSIHELGLDRKIHPRTYDNLLTRLAGASKTAKDTLMSEKTVTLKTASVDATLESLDKVAAAIQANCEAWGMPFGLAKALTNKLDKMADELETAAYGEESVLNRQASVLGFAKEAEVLERDSDEPYMDTFNAPMRTHQSDSDEAFMAAFNDDQSSAVRHRPGSK